MKAGKTGQRTLTQAKRTKAEGPSVYEMEYLRQLREELEIFLRSRSFGTIHKFDIAFQGGDYVGHMQVGA